MEKLTIFIERLQKIGINTTYTSNYPWVYIETVNNSRIKEKHASDWGFVVGYSGKDFKFENLSKIFNVIRKYLKSPQKE
jgi:hypothetical protein